MYDKNDYCVVLLQQCLLTPHGVIMVFIPLVFKSDKNFRNQPNSVEGNLKKSGKMFNGTV